MDIDLKLPKEKGKRELVIFTQFDNTYKYLWPDDFAHVFITENGRTIERKDGKLFMFRITNGGKIIRESCTTEFCSFHKNERSGASSKPARKKSKKVK